jgi:hypothetical protein
MSRKRDITIGKDFSYAGDDGVSQLSLKLAEDIDIASAADLSEEGARIRDAIRVDAIAAHGHGAEFFVSDSDGRRGAPLLVDLKASGKEVEIGLEGRLETLGPVHEVGENGQVVSVEGVKARSEYVGDSAFVDESGHLGFAHGELCAVLYLHIAHGIAIGKDAVFRLIPLDDSDELFGNELFEGHVHLLR